MFRVVAIFKSVVVVQAGRLYVMRKQVNMSCPTYMTRTMLETYPSHCRC
jgi:hypothetical protein